MALADHRHLSVKSDFSADWEISVDLHAGVSSIKIADRGLYVGNCWATASNTKPSARASAWLFANYEAGNSSAVESTFLEH